MGVFHGDLDRSAGVQVASSATTSKRRRNDLNDNDYDAAEGSSGSPGIDDQEDLLHLNSKRLSNRGLVGYRSVFSSDTRGTGFMHRAFLTYAKHRGLLGNVRKGVLVTKNLKDIQGPALAIVLERLKHSGAFQETFEVAKTISMGPSLKSGSKVHEPDEHPSPTYFLTSSRS